MEALIQEVAEKNIPGLIEALKLEMKSAARMLEFEKLAQLRDQMMAFKKALASKAAKSQAFFPRTFL